MTIVTAENLNVTCSTFSFTNTGSTPKNGLIGQPGFSLPSGGPGWGTIAIPPISRNKTIYDEVECGYQNVVQ